MRPGSQRKLTPSTARTAPRFLSWKILVRLRASIMLASSSQYARGVREITVARSAFVAVGTLLGVELVGRHRKHVVALDAHSMDQLGRLASGFGWGCGLGRFAHLWILTGWGGWASSADGGAKGTTPLWSGALRRALRLRQSGLCKCGMEAHLAGIVMC